MYRGRIKAGSFLPDGGEKESASFHKFVRNYQCKPFSIRPYKLPFVESFLCVSWTHTRLAPFTAWTRKNRPEGRLFWLSWSILFWPSTIIISCRHLSAAASYLIKVLLFQSFLYLFIIFLIRHFEHAPSSRKALSWLFVIHKISYQNTNPCCKCC